MVSFIYLDEHKEIDPAGIEIVRYYLRPLQSNDENARLSNPCYSLKEIEDSIKSLEEDLKEIRKNISSKKKN